MSPLTSLRDEESAFVTDVGVPPTSKTRSETLYLKQYGELVVNYLQQVEEATEQFTKPSGEKQKELWYVKDLFEKQCGTIKSLPF